MPHADSWARARRGGAPLTTQEVDGFIDWARLLDARYDSALDIAIGRVMRALIERPDRADSLIDAVIALESLFGHTGTSEVMFRVTAAAAHLLVSDPAQRAAFRRELVDIYDVRSKVIHGGQIGAKDKLRERSDRAVEISISALRALLVERPALIADRDRGMRLILGTAGHIQCNSDDLADQSTDRSRGSG